MTDNEPHWSDDEAELDRIQDLINTDTGREPFDFTLVKSISDLEKMAELLQWSWQAEEEDTDLDRDSQIFIIQQRVIQEFINEIVEEIRRREENPTAAELLRDHWQGNKP